MKITAQQEQRAGAFHLVLQTTNLDAHSLVTDHREVVQAMVERAAEDIMVTLTGLAAGRKAP